MDLTPGRYVIREEQQPGWVQSLPGGGGSWVFDVVEGVFIDVAHFGNYEAAGGPKVPALSWWAMVGLALALTVAAYRGLARQRRSHQHG